MQKPLGQTVPILDEIESRAGLRFAFRQLHRFLTNFVAGDHAFKQEVVNAVNPLYGEADYSPSLLANGAQTTTTITVAGAILGYTAEVSYDKDLQALQMTAHVSADDTVTVVLKNDTGAGVTLTAGRFRAYVWPRFLSA